MFPSTLEDAANAVHPLSEASLDAFIEIFRSGVLGAGEDFVAEGDIADSVAFVESGLLRSYYISPKGEETNKHFFVSGTFVAPLTSLVLATPSPLYIGALEDSRIQIARYADLESLYERFPDLNILGRKLVEHAWIGKERRETQLIMLNATARYRAFVGEFPDLEDRIPQYQIASYLGITPVQLSRIRTRLKKPGA